MATVRGEAGRRWYGTWFWGGFTLLGLGLALVALGEVRVISAGVDQFHTVRSALHSCG